MDVAAATSSAPVVNLTDAAAEQLRSMLAESDKSGKAFRLYVESGGCSGLQYGMTFDENREGDLSATLSGVTVLVDSFSADYLRGAVVDYSDALTGGGFKITNPKARESCGCGKSFQT